jgi:hypothetical protein
MIELIEGLPKNVVGIFVQGRVTAQECRDVLTPAVEKSLKRHDKIRLYYEIGSRFPGAAWDELDLGGGRASRCERVAIVTDIAWVRLTVKALRFLFPGEIRVFPTIQAAEGREWIATRRASPIAADAVGPARRRGGRSAVSSEGLRLDARSALTPISRRPKKGAAAASPPVVLVMPIKRRGKSASGIGAEPDRYGHASLA